MADCWKVRGEERPTISNIENRLAYLSTKLPSLVFPKASTGHTPFSPRSTEPTFTTFLSSTDQQRLMSVAMERYSYSSLTDAHQPSRHSGTSFISDVKMRRASGTKKRSSGHLSSTSAGRGGDHLSLSFSILSANDDASTSSTDSDNDGAGSFPSTLRSTRSTTTGTATDSQPLTAGSISTLQQPSPPLGRGGMYPTTSESPDFTSKTSTIDDSTSARSSVLLQPTNQSTSGTDRSSFYSTGIDSVSTTFSTPLPNSVSANTPSIELKTYGVLDDGGLLGKSLARPVESTSPFTGKSTDSGIRSDEETNSTNGHLTVQSRQDTIVPLRTDVHGSPAATSSNNTGSNSARISSHASRTSFGLGLSDMSSELMAAFEQFSFK